MPFTTLTLESLEDRSFEPLTELPPFAELLPGTRVSIAHLAGPVAAAGEIAAMRTRNRGIPLPRHPRPRVRLPAHRISHRA